MKREKSLNMYYSLRNIISVHQYFLIEIIKKFNNRCDVLVM